MNFALCQYNNTNTILGRDGVRKVFRKLDDKFYPNAAKFYIIFLAFKQTQTNNFLPVKAITIWCYT